MTLVNDTRSDQFIGTKLKLQLTTVVLTKLTNSFLCVGIFQKSTNYKIRTCVTTILANTVYAIDVQNQGSQLVGKRNGIIKAILLQIEDRIAFNAKYVIQMHQFRLALLDARFSFVHNSQYCVGLPDRDNAMHDQSRYICAAYFAFSSEVFWTSAIQLQEGA